MSQPPQGEQPPYPPQGQPQQGYPQQGSPQQGYGQGPEGGAYGPAPRTRTRNRTGLFVLVGAGALALVLAVVAVAVNVGGRDGSSRNAAGAAASAGGTSTSAPVVTNASDAVQGFLEAVAAHDAGRALGYTDEVPTDKTFLTDDALRASTRLTPLSAISVPPVTDENAYKVASTFTLGGKQYARDYLVKKGADGWKVTDGVVDLDLSYQRQESLPMIVNGSRVTSDTVSLLPGTYAFTTGSKWVSYGSHNVLTVAERDVLMPSGFATTLTKAGRAEALSKTKAAFTSCLARRRLKPSGCPNYISDTNGIKVKESSVRWRVTNNPFRNARFELDSSDPSIAEATFYPDYRIRLAGTQRGRAVSGDSRVTGLSSFDARADLSKNSISVKLQR